MGNMSDQRGEEKTGGERIRVSVPHGLGDNTGDKSFTAEDP